MSIEKCSCIATRKTGRATFRLRPAMHRMIGTEPWRIIFSFHCKITECVRQSQ